MDALWTVNVIQKGIVIFRTNSIFAVGKYMNNIIMGLADKSIQSKIE